MNRLLHASSAGPRTLLVCLALASLTPSGAPQAAAGQDAVARVRLEFDRLRQSLKERPIAGTDQAAVSEATDAALQTSAAALDAGRLYLSLENLDRASELIEGARFAADKAESVASGLPAFESIWEETSRGIAPRRGRPDERPRRRSCAAARALSESARGRVVPLMEGGRGFAVATRPSDGLFYLGQARGAAAFADFCASLDLPGTAAPFPLRSMLPELHRLQEKATAAFRPPRSIELHDRFIALNSTLKLGLELDAAQAYAGSVYEYLEAVRHDGMLEAPPLDAAGQSKVTEDLAAARARLDASQRDESIARIFLERAASQAAHADGSAPSADEWRSARVILDRVLPAYFAARVTETAARRSSRRSIRMTLVRWPYT